MRQLTRITHRNIYKTFTGPSRILAEHLQMNSPSAQIDLHKNYLSLHHNPCLRKLTFHSDIEFVNKNVQQQNGTNNNKNLNVETLRLKRFSAYSSFDIVNNEIVIETLNLQNSLKNLLLNTEFGCLINEKMKISTHGKMQLNQ